MERKKGAFEGAPDGVSRDAGKDKNQLRDAGNDLIFSQDTGSIHPHREPL